MLKLNLTLIIHQLCGTDVLKKRLYFLHRRTVKLIFPDTTLTTDHKFKTDEDNEPTQTTGIQKGLFMYRVLNNEASEYISNLYTRPP